MFFFNIYLKKKLHNITSLPKSSYIPTLCSFSLSKIKKNNKNKSKNENRQTTNKDQ